MAWGRRVLLILLIALLALAASGVIYQLVATAMDRRSYPAPGQLVDVGGSQLYIRCIGKVVQTVILEAAAGRQHPATGVGAARHRQRYPGLCLDRAGMGWSERGPKPRDLKQHVSELRALLSAAGVEAPYVLVGHSYGARVALVYAKEYPRDVVGMALVDPGNSTTTRVSHPRIAPTRNSATYNNACSLACPVRRSALVLAGGRLRRSTNGKSGVGARVQCLTKFFLTISDQYEVLPQTYSQQREVTDLGSIPLSIVSATVPDDAIRRVWTEMNGESAKLSTRGVHRTVPGATHSTVVQARACPGNHRCNRTSGRSGQSISLRDRNSPK